VIVAASTECFPDLPLEVALQRLVDLEYTNVEIDIHENGNHLKPSEVLADFEKAVDRCRHTLRLTPVAYSVDIAATGEAYYEQFEAICRLAKATKVVCLIIPSAELGTPFNEEVERLRKLVAIAAVEGAVVGLKTEYDRISGDPDTVGVLCENAKGLAVSLDPSHLAYGDKAGGNYESLLKYTSHVHLRDTKKDEFQVRVGQGDIEYGRLVTLLDKHKYKRALSVHLQPIEDIDHTGEMRKLRLLLESLL
jgi:sugar phosphate isomerase/epimerase